MYHMLHHDSDAGYYNRPLGIARRDIKKGELIVIEVSCRSGEQVWQSEAIDFSKEAIDAYLQIQS